jgi:hypothetical protein
MTQEDLVLQLHEEGISAVAIHMRLFDVFGPLAIGYSSVTKITKRTSWMANSPARPGRSHNEQFDELVLDALENEPNVSIRQISNMTRIPSTKMHNILSKLLGFISRKCRFVPHALTDTLRAHRLAKSIELLQVLTQTEQTNWRFILTGDESLFFYYTVNSRIWLPPDAETPKVARRLINKPKIMVTVFWNPSGLYVNRFLEIGTSFNSTYFIEYVLGDIEHMPAL